MWYPMKCITTTENKQIGLAPMSGYTDHVMRRLSRAHGADFAYSEMLSSSALSRGHTTLDSLSPDDRVPIQLFGSDPKELVCAAKIVEDRAAWVDINAACPVRKVTKKGAGAALLREPEKIASMIRMLKDHTGLKVSVKIRLGWSANTLLNILDTVCDEYPDILIIHGRTASQGYRGKADWKAIQKAANHLDGLEVVILGSGDLFTPDDIVQALSNTRVNGVVVARGAIGNPWIFRQSKDLLRTGAYRCIPLDERLRLFNYHVEQLIEAYGEYGAIRRARKLFSGYTRGIIGAAEMRSDYMKLDSFGQVQRFVNNLIEEKRSTS